MTAVPAQRFQIVVGHSQYMLRGLDADEQEAPYHGGNGLIWVNRTGDGAVVMTGLDTGDLPITIQVLNAAPELDLEPWDDVVEVSMTITGPDLTILSPYEIEGVHRTVTLPAASQEPRSYRLQVHARGRDQGREAFEVDTDEGDETVEQHQILIWPAPPAEEARIKLTDTVGQEIRGDN